MTNVSMTNESMANKQMTNDRLGFGIWLIGICSLSIVLVGCGPGLAAVPTPTPLPPTATPPPTETPIPSPTPTWSVRMPLIEGKGERREASPSGRRPTPRPTLPPPKCEDPNCCIAYPPVGARLSGNVIFRGTAWHEAFWYYKVEFRPVGTEAGWSVLYRSEEPVRDGPLMTWVTSTVPPGEYEVRLVVVDKTGNYPPPCEVRVVVLREEPFEFPW